MVLRNIKLFIGVSIMLAFISVSLFGMIQFKHEAGVPMVNCPYAQNSSSICQNIIDHVKNWTQFFNVVFPTLLALFLFFGLVRYLFDLDSVTSIRHSYRWKYYLDSENLYSYRQAITKWLSLFENSPSFSYGGRY